MGEIKIVKLKFQSAVHLGADIAGVGQEDTQLIAHSDTLFSCLINSYAQLHSRDLNVVKKLLETFCDEEPAFRLSSGFPFHQIYRQIGYQTVYYLPKPLVDPPDFYDEELGRVWKQEYSKKVKSRRFAPLNMFKDWLEGEEIYPGSDSSWGELDKYYVVEIRPQHARDRLTDASLIYHTGLVHFDIDAGIYFLIELNDMNILDWDDVSRILKQAGQNGLGGRRSLGNGIFKVNEDTIQDLDDDWQELFNLPQQSGRINLSLYFPKNIDKLEPMAYQLTPRRGWCFSSVSTKQMKRKTCTMFAEGSVFRNKMEGSMADVTPVGFSEHKIYRYGIPISLPIKILE